MKILHGEDHVKSRLELAHIIADAKLKDWEVVEMLGKEITLTDLKQALESLSLFGQERLVVIEDLFSRQTSKARQELLDYLAKEKPKALLIWESKTVTATQAKPFAGSDIKEFKLPQMLFSFLDDITPKRGLLNLRNLESVLKAQPGELVFALLVKRVRQLLVLNAGGLDVLDEVEKLAAWQKNKLLKQAGKFATPLLRGWYADMLRFDAARKSGKTSLTMDEQLRYWMARI